MADGDGPQLMLGRYALRGEVASGGMATVYLGCLQGPVGFSRLVAIKRMHPHVARDPDFSFMFLDEASLAARIQHPNVVATLDVVADEAEAFIVMEYVKGASLAALLRGEDRKRIQVGIAIAVSITIGLLSGLHAAHEARTDDGKSLEIVHRDVSPQNVLVGLDGLARITDFGVAKAAIRSGVTRDNQVKGKLCYMAPEQMAGRHVDRRADVFAAGAVLWEMLAGRRLFTGQDTGALVARVIDAAVPPLGKYRKDVPAELEAVLRRALHGSPAQRFATAQDFADALEEVAPRLASQRTVGAWVAARAADELARREKLVTTIEEELSVDDDEEPAPDKPAPPRPAAGQPAPAKDRPAPPRPAAGQPAPAKDRPAPPRPAAGRRALAGGKAAPLRLVAGQAAPAPTGAPSAGAEATPMSTPGPAVPASTLGSAAAVNAPGAPLPVDDTDPSTPLDDPALEAPLSSPLVSTPLSNPALPTPLSGPGTLLPSSPNGAALSAFPKPAAGVAAIRARNRTLTLVGAATSLAVVGVALVVLYAGPSSHTVAETADADSHPPTAAEAVHSLEPPDLDDLDDSDEPAASASAASSSVAMAPAPSASASAVPTAKPKTDKATQPRKPQRPYLPAMP